MALSYGFYNSIDGDRKYDAVQMGRIFDGIIKDGIYATYLKAMVVIASDNAGEVIIQPGRAWFNHTWSYNDANLIMQAPDPEVLLERIDALVLEVNEELGVRANTYKWIQGTPASQNVQRPTLTNTVTVHQYPLCYVHRYPETSTIQAKDITNTVGTSECPFVTGVLEGIEIDDWMRQWDDEFHTWENETKTDFLSWQTDVKDQFSTWQSTEKTSFEAWEDQQVAAYNIWFAAVETQQRADKADWDAWYASTVASLHNLPQNTAEYLQLEIDDIKTNGASGSFIKVTTPNASLEGRTCSITSSDGLEVKSANFDSNLTVQFSGFKSVGDVTITSTDGSQTATSVVNIPYFGNYAFTIAFWSATVNIQGDEELIGLPVTVKDSNGVTVGTVTLDSDAEGTFYATKADVYSFQVSYEGETIIETINVASQTTYSIALSVFKAIININGQPASILKNKIVTVASSDGGNTGTVTLDNDAQGVFVAKKPATYVFTLDY